MSDTAELVARNVRRFRLERSLSLGELARRAGLSKQTLSKLEQGIGNPTVDTLSDIGSALEVSLRGLLTEWGTPVFVQRQHDSAWAQDGTVAERLLDQIYGSGYVHTKVLRLERGAGPEVPADQYAAGTLHHLYVISGRVRCGPVREPVELAAGDFIRFPADVAHRHDCLTERALLHLVTTLPQVPQLGPAARHG